MLKQKNNLVFYMVLAFFFSSYSLPAFPEAQGAGTSTIGGRSGKIIEVTNLNDAGTGSFRAAISSSGPRIVVFRVSGTIALSTPLTINNPYITIAGQTAPGGGIAVSGKNLANKDLVINITTHDVVWRYTRIRKGYNSTPSWGTNVINITLGAYHVVLDHLSLSWTQDDNITFWGASGSNPPNKCTVSWTMFYEPLVNDNSHHNLEIGASSPASADLMQNLDFHHNFLAHSTHRNPGGFGKSGRFINNIVFHYTFYGSQFGGGASADFINNIYKQGPSGTHEIQAYTSASGGIWPAGVPSGNPSLYVSGNKGPNNADPSADNWTSMVRESRGFNGAEKGLLSASYRRITPLQAVDNAIIADATVDLESALLPTVGASRCLDANGNWINIRDVADTRIINDYNTGKALSLVNDESTVGGFPAITAGTPYTDADHDAMPDTWEKKYGLNSNDALDGPKDKDGDGYTNVEEFLNGSNPLNLTLGFLPSNFIHSPDRNNIKIINNRMSITGQTEKKSIAIEDLQGRMLSSFPDKSNKIILPLERFASGIHFVKIRVQNKTYIDKFILIR